jgi:hypothetical protein
MIYSKQEVITQEKMWVPYVCVFMHHITENLAMTEGCFIGEPKPSLLWQICHLDMQSRDFLPSEHVRILLGSQYEPGQKCYKLYAEFLANTIEKTFVMVQYDKIDWINFCLVEETLRKVLPVNPVIITVFYHVSYGCAPYLEIKQLAEDQYDEKSCFSLYVLMSAITELRSVGLKELFPLEKHSDLEIFAFFFGSGEEYKNFVEKKPFRILTLPELTRKMEDYTVLLNCFDSYSPNQMILKCSSGNVAKN